MARIRKLTLSPVVLASAVIVFSFMLVRQDAMADVTSWPIGPGGGGSCSSGMGIDGSGNVYANDPTFRAFRKYGPDGSGGELLPANIGGTPLPASDGGIYFVKPAPPRLIHLDGNGAVLPEIPLTGAHPYAFRSSAPRAGAVGPSGEIYLLRSNESNDGTGQLVKFTDRGTFERAWTPADTGYMFNPSLAVGADGNVYINDTSQHIQVFSPEGTLLRQWGGLGTAADQFLAIYGVATTPDGHVFVGEDQRTDSTKAFGGIRSFTSTGQITGSTDYYRSWNGGALATYGNDLLYQLACREIIRYDLRKPSITKLAFDNPQAPTGGGLTRVTAGSDTTVIASANVPFGEIRNYEFDLDGDGNYETASPTGSVVTKFSSVGNKTVGVRVTSDRGGQATAAQSLEVLDAPPLGPVGISINDGDFATNSEQVNIDPVWRLGSRKVLLSNDGSFRQSEGFDVQPSIRWELTRAGAQQSTRVVYARFDASLSYGSQTYTDDILFDKARPLIQEATSPQARTSATKRRYTVRLRAQQARSGLSIAQFSPSKSGGSTVTLRSKKVRGITRLTRSFAVESKKAPRFVRVQSTAGTWSSWKPIRRR